MEETKTFVAQKGKGAVDKNTIIRWFKKFCSDCKNLDDQVWSGRPKTGFWGWAPSHRGIPREYQASLESHSPVWFLSFTTSAKTSGVKLWFML